MSLFENEFNNFKKWKILRTETIEDAGDITLVRK